MRPQRATTATNAKTPLRATPLPWVPIVVFSAIAMGAVDGLSNATVATGQRASPQHAARCEASAPGASALAEAARELTREIAREIARDLVERVALPPSGTHGWPVNNARGGDAAAGSPASMETARAAWCTQMLDITRPASRLRAQLGGGWRAPPTQWRGNV